MSRGQTFAAYEKTMGSQNGCRGTPAINHPHRILLNFLNNRCLLLCIVQWCPASFKSSKPNLGQNIAGYRFASTVKAWCVHMVVAVISHRVVMRRSVRPRPRPCPRLPPAAVRGVNGDWSRHGDNLLLTTSHRDKAETSVNRDDTYLHHKKVDICISWSHFTT